MSTSIHAKPIAIHLGILPSSCHTQGIVTGLVVGQFYRIYTLCSQEKQEVHTFFQCLLDHGYSLAQPVPIFITAKEQACKHWHRHQGLPQLHQPSPQPILNKHRVFFHLQQYHPLNPTTQEIQQFWEHMVMQQPPNQPPFYKLRNSYGNPIAILNITIAYSWAPNLGNILSFRKLKVCIEDYTDNPFSTLPQTRRRHTTHNHYTTQEMVKIALLLPSRATYYTSPLIWIFRHTTHKPPDNENCPSHTLPCQQSNSSPTWENHPTPHFGTGWANLLFPILCVTEVLFGRFKDSEIGNTPCLQYHYISLKLREISFNMEVLIKWDLLKLFYEIILLFYDNKY